MQVRYEISNRNAFLRHRITMANCDGLMIEGLKVNRHTEWCADLILASIPPANRLGLVVVTHEMRLQRLEDLTCFSLQFVLLGQRQHGNFVRGEPMVEAQYGTDLAVDLLFVVNRKQQRHHRSGCPGRWLDAMGRVALVGSLIEIVKLLTRMIHVLREVKVTTVSNTFKLTPTPREGELNVGSATRVVTQLVSIVGADTQHVGRNTSIEIPVVALLNPVLVSLGGLRRRLFEQRTGSINRPPMDFGLCS
jgi:hypothetical protein